MRAKMDEDIKVVLERLERRIPARVVGFMPAVPLYAFSLGVPEDGVILRYLFPMAGTISKLFVSVVGATPQRTLTVHAELVATDGTGQYVEGTLRKDMTILDLSLPVAAGSRLTVLTSTPWDGPVEVAAVFTPTMGVGEAHRAMVDELGKEWDKEKEKQDEGA